MARTMGGQGSRSSGQSQNQMSRNANQRPQVMNQGNNDGNNNAPPVTLEAIQQLLRDAQVQNRIEMNQLLDQRLGDQSRTLSGSRTRSDTPEGVFHSQSSTHGGSVPLPPPPPVGPMQTTLEKCTYKDFMTCRPKEFKGEKDPKITIRWVTEMEQVLRICRCEQDMKVAFASQMLKGDALTWWNNLITNLGGNVVASFTWEEFVRRLKAKFCSPRHKEQIVNEFFALRKGDMSVDEYSKKFSEMVPFLEETLPTEIGRINRYISGLPGDYLLEVSKATTLDEAIDAAAKVEDMLTKKEKERREVGEK